jgi:hypothetical protein
MHIPRRTFIAAPLATPLIPGLLDLQTPSARGRTATGPGDEDLSYFPRQDPALVQAVVGRSHSSLDGVRELVEGHPELAKAAIDWGFGDWESALGAASHTGQREIALYLIDHGARPNLFTHAMLGHLEVVKATIEAMPGIQRTPGPHGIPLLAHARFGGEPARDVYEYLEALGDAGDQQIPTDLAEAERSACVGRYRLEDDRDIEFDVTLKDDQLWIGFRRLCGVPGKAATLHPAGAPSVHINFDIQERVPPVAGSLSIATPARTLRAVRI